MSLSKEDLSSVFKVPGKTLKLETRLSNQPINDAITLATRFVLDNTEGVNRVEFKHGSLYYVIAKLNKRRKSV